jgi:hypothetical protein
MGSTPILATDLILSTYFRRTVFFKPPDCFSLGDIFLLMPFFYGKLLQSIYSNYLFDAICSIHNPLHLHTGISFSIRNMDIPYYLDF